MTSVFPDTDPFNDKQTDPLFHVYLLNKKSSKSTHNKSLMTNKIHSTACHRPNDVEKVGHKFPKREMNESRKRGHYGRVRGFSKATHREKL